MLQTTPETPDVMVRVGLLAFHVGKNERVSRNTKATVQVSMGQSQAATLRTGFEKVMGRFISRDGAGYAGIRAHRGGPLGERMPTFVGGYPILARQSACNIRAHRLTCRHSAVCPDSGRAWLAHMVGAACRRGP